MLRPRQFGIQHKYADEAWGNLWADKSMCESLVENSIAFFVPLSKFFFDAVGI